MPDQVPREVPIISATLIFPRYSRDVYPKLSLTFEKKNNCVTLFPIFSHLSIGYLREFYLDSVSINYILNEVKIGRVQFDEILIAAVVLILLSSSRNYPRVSEIDSRQVSKCQRDFSQPVLFLSLSPSRGNAIELGGAGALCIYAGLNGGRVAEEVPVCGPEIKRPSANEVNGARGFPGTVGSDPRYSRRVREAVGQRRHAIAPRQRSGRTPANYPATRSQCERSFDRVGRRSMHSCEILTPHDT